MKSKIQEERQEDIEATVRQLDNTLILAQHAVDDIGALMAQVKALGNGCTPGQLRALQELNREARGHTNPIRSNLDTAFLCVDTFIDRERARQG